MCVGPLRRLWAIPNIPPPFFSWRSIYDGLIFSECKIWRSIVTLSAAPPQPPSLRSLPDPQHYLLILFCGETFSSVNNSSRVSLGVRNTDEMPGFLQCQKVPFWMRQIFEICLQCFSTPVNVSSWLSFYSLIFMWKMYGSPICVLRVLQLGRLTSQRRVVYSSLGISITWVFGELLQITLD